jgi:hypothetical protein
LERQSTKVEKSFTTVFSNDYDLMLHYGGDDNTVFRKEKEFKDIKHAR